MKVINLKLKELFKEKCLTRYEISKRTNIKFQTIDRYYKNQMSKYDKFILIKICLAAECDISDIMKIEEV